MKIVGPGCFKSQRPVVQSSVSPTRWLRGKRIKCTCIPHIKPIVKFCCGSLVYVFGIRVSAVTFHIMFVHIICRLVWVAEWPPFKKALPTRSTKRLFVF